MSAHSRDAVLVRLLLATRPELLEAHQAAVGVWRSRFRRHTAVASVVLLAGLIVQVALPLTKIMTVGVLVSILDIAGVFTALAAYCLGHVHAYTPPPAWRHRDGEQP